MPCAGWALSSRRTMVAQNGGSPNAHAASWTLIWTGYSPLAPSYEPTSCGPPGTLSHRRTFAGCWISRLRGVHAANAYYYRKLELDQAIFRRSNAALAKSLLGGNQLTRTELARVLEDIVLDGKTYWFAPSAGNGREHHPSVHLLPVPMTRFRRQDSTLACEP